MPDSQAGYFRNFKLRIFLSSDDDESNSSNQGQAAEHGWNGNPLVILTRGVNGTEIKNLFLMGIRKSLIGERQPA